MYLLDTNAIIDFCNAKLPVNAKNLLLQIEQPNISVITRIELFCSTKIPEFEKQRLEQFIQFANVQDILNLDIINETIRIRQQYKIKLPDAIIAATALTNNLALVSRNEADFSKVESLKFITHLLYNSWVHLRISKVFVFPLLLEFLLDLS